MSTLKYMDMNINSFNKTSLLTNNFLCVQYFYDGTKNNLFLKDFYGKEIMNNNCNFYFVKFRIINDLLNYFSIKDYIFIIII